MPLEMPELDKLWCLYGKKWNIKKLWLKAIAFVESSFNQTAYRYEPKLWTDYPKFWEKVFIDYPELKGRDASELAASYGLMQILLTTAFGLGFRGRGEELYDPAVNINLGAKLVRQLTDQIEGKGAHKGTQLWVCEIAAARYNGGASGNPGSDGKLRNQKYVNRVFKKYCELRATEDECSEEE